MNCMDCGGSECVCRMKRELREAGEALAVYEAFFEHVESCSMTYNAPQPEVEGIYVDGSNGMRLTPRAKAAWLAVCEMIDRRRGLSPAGRS